MSMARMSHAGRRAAERGASRLEHSAEERCAQWLAALQVFGVLGNPVAHSRSPALHNAALAAAGLDAVYLPFLVDDLRSFLRSFSAPDFKGFSVTIPHKVPACHQTRAGHPAFLLAGPRRLASQAPCWPKDYECGCLCVALTGQEFFVPFRGQNCQFWKKCCVERLGRHLMMAGTCCSSQPCKRLMRWTQWPRRLAR